MDDSKPDLKNGRLVSYHPGGFTGSGPLDHVHIQPGERYITAEQVRAIAREEITAMLSQVADRGAYRG